MRAARRCRSPSGPSASGSFFLADAHAHSFVRHGHQPARVAAHSPGSCRACLQRRIDRPAARPSVVARVPAVRFPAAKESATTPAKTKALSYAVGRDRRRRRAAAHVCACRAPHASPTPTPRTRRATPRDQGAREGAEAKPVTRCKSHVVPLERLRNDLGRAPASRAAAAGCW